MEQPSSARRDGWRRVEEEEDAARRPKLPPR